MICASFSACYFAKRDLILFGNATQGKEYVVYQYIQQQKRRQNLLLLSIDSFLEQVPLFPIRGSSYSLFIFVSLLLISLLL